MHNINPPAMKNVSLLLPADLGRFLLMRLQEKIFPQFGAWWWRHARRPL